MTFKTIYTKEAIKFLMSLPENARDKITYNILKVAGGYMDAELFKKLENSEIWEFRTLFNGIAYRLLAFWDTQNETLVIATHGFIKKKQKTPAKEIAKAEEIRKQYFEQLQSQIKTNDEQKAKVKEELKYPFKDFTLDPDFEDEPYIKGEYHLKVSLDRLINKKDFYTQKLQELEFMKSYVNSKDLAIENDKEEFYEKAI